MVPKYMCICNISGWDIPEYSLPQQTWASKSISSPILICHQKRRNKVVRIPKHISRRNSSSKKTIGIQTCSLNENIRKISTLRNTTILFPQPLWNGGWNNRTKNRTLAQTQIGNSMHRMRIFFSWRYATY